MKKPIVKKATKTQGKRISVKPGYIAIMFKPGEPITKNDLEDLISNGNIPPYPKALPEITEKQILPETMNVLGHELVSHIFEEMGAVSACWTEFEKAGVFKSTEAAYIGNDLCNTIAKKFAPKDSVVKQITPKEFIDKTVRGLTDYTRSYQNLMVVEILGLLRERRHKDLQAVDENFDKAAKHRAIVQNENDQLNEFISGLAKPGK